MNSKKINLDKNFNYITFFYGLLFFGTSLQSYYFYNLKSPTISLFCLIAGILFYFLFNNKLKFFFELKLILATYVYLLISAFILVIFFDNNIDHKRLLGYLLIIISFIFYFNIFSYLNISKILEIFLCIHVVAFYIQFFCHYILNLNIDYIVHFTGEEQRTYGDGLYIILGELYRSTGLFIEPGTYVSFIAPIIALYSKYFKFLKFSFYIYFFSLATLVLSFSTLGLIYFLIILFFIPFNRFLKLILFLGAITTSFSYYVWRFIDKVNFGGGSGLDSRIGFIEYIYSSIMNSYFNLFFGSGLLTTDNNINFAVNDSSLLVYIFFSSGIFGLLFFIINKLIIYKKIPGSNKIALIILLLSKIPIYAPFYPLLISIIILDKKKGR